MSALSGGVAVWGLAGAGMASVMAGWGSYMAAIPRGTVPRRPVGMFLTQSLGLALAAAALLLASHKGGVPGGVIGLAGFSVFMALFFFFLFGQRRTPVGTLQVQTGQAMLPFEALDADGAAVRSDDWRGKRVLLKFFRGGW